MKFATLFVVLLIVSTTKGAFLFQGLLGPAQPNYAGGQYVRPGQYQSAFQPIQQNLGADWRTLSQVYYTHHIWVGRVHNTGYEVRRGDWLAFQSPRTSQQIYFQIQHDWRTIHPSVPHVLYSVPELVQIAPQIQQNYMRQTAQAPQEVARARTATGDQGVPLEQESAQLGVDTEPASLKESIWAFLEMLGTACDIIQMYTGGSKILTAHSPHARGVFTTIDVICHGQAVTDVYKWFQDVKARAAAAGRPGMRGFAEVVRSDFTAFGNLIIHSPGSLFSDPDKAKECANKMTVQVALENFARVLDTIAFCAFIWQMTGLVMHTFGLFMSCGFLLTGAGLPLAVIGVAGAAAGLAATAIDKYYNYDQEEMIDEETRKDMEQLNAQLEEMDVCDYGPMHIKSAGDLSRNFKIKPHYHLA